MDATFLGARGHREALWDWNLLTRRIDFSPEWVSLVGCDEHEVGGTVDAWLQRVHSDDLEQVTRAIEAHLATGTGELNVPHRLRHKDGTHRWMACHARIQRNAAGEAVRLTGCHRDATAATVADPATGLPNRLLFLERVGEALEQANRHGDSQLAVLIVDLDRPAADHPRAAGGADPVLTSMARRLETCLRSGSSSLGARSRDFVARLEGDQFGILLSGFRNVSYATVVADAVLSVVLTPLSINGREFRLSPSIGIAVSSTGYASTADLVRDAEAAVHRARLLSGARWEMFDTAILKSEEAEIQLENDFRGGLERGEFQLYYQPIVALDSNRIVGLEALVRWQHPHAGLLLPADFVPLAEKTGFILPLSNWVVQEACRQLKAWQDQLPLSTDVWVSANLSGLQFKHPGLVEQIAAALSDSALDPRCLVLELTEGIAMENPAAVKSVLMQLRIMGVRISLDDFGTGHSSLAYLRQFPVDSLKVDRSFVRGAETNREMRDILDTIMGMAQTLGLRVVAEGIENEGELASVQSPQCDYGQGYLFAKPLDQQTCGLLLTSGLPERERPAPAAVVWLRPEPRLSEARGVDEPPRHIIPLRLAAAAILLVSIALPARLLWKSEAVPATQSAPLASAPGVAAAQAGRTGTTPAPEARSALSTSATKAPPVAVPPVVSARVAHQHKLGSCIGRLVATPQGLAFVPEAGTQAKDAFEFARDQFLYVLAADELTIRSNSRTYRFKAVVEESADGGRDALQRVADSLSRAKHP